MTKVDELLQKLDAFMTFGPHHHLPTFCAIYSSSAHFTNSCPYNTSYPDIREDQNFHRPSHNNHYTDISNLGWVSDPNFSWSHRSHLGGPTDFIHHSALPPQYPQLFEQPHKPSLEDTLQMFMQNTTQFQQETQTIIAKMEMQMGLLVITQSEKEVDKIPNQPITNSIGQLEIEASSHNEQANPITTLGNNQIIDIHKSEPLEIDIMDDDDSSIHMSDNLVSDFIVPSSSIDPLEECLAQCDLDFNDDAPVEKVNVLLNSTLDIATTELPHDAEVTHAYSHEN